MQVVDREDHRQLAIMTQARRELLALRDQASGAIRHSTPIHASGATNTQAAAA
jgi:hypothetical protein